MGAAPCPLQPREYPEDVRVEFGLEGVELEEISELPSGEAEVSEWPLRRYQVRCWGGRSACWCCELLEEAQSRKNSKAFLELGGGQSPKNAKGVQGQSWKNFEMALEWK